MSFFKVLVFISLFSVLSFGADKERPAVDIARGFEEYNKKNYEEVLLLVQAVKDARQMSPKWMYLEGLCLYRLGRYKEAEIVLDNFTKRMDAAGAPSARGYYFLGLTYFYGGDYQKSLNAFQISQDFSQDSILDRTLDDQIDKTIRFRDYYDSHKPGTFAFIFGYEFHNNVLNLSRDSVDKSLNGHVFNYGVSLGYRPIDRMNFVFEPSVAVVDRYTFDKSFKADSTLQALDVLQGAVSLPVFFYFGNNRGVQYNVSLNAYSAYLPITTSNRELYTSAVFLKLRTLFDISQKMSMDLSLLSAADKGYNFSSAEDDSTGSRNELVVSLKQVLNRERTELLTYTIEAAVKNAEGTIPRYQRGRLGLIYQFPSFAETNSSIELRYEYLKYPDRSTPRTDNKAELEYVLTHSLSENSTFNYNLGAAVNSSDTEVYKYDDYFLGAQYIFTFGF